MEKKYIHYCWFGDKPLPKLAKKCIKSWEKYLPEFEIIKWSEENVNINECAFVKKAYENKKWAFVADYARAKALKEMGGLYFDTDMEVTKNIDALLDNETFLGIEDTGYVAAGVWYEKNPNGLIPSELLKTYQSMKDFNQEIMTSVAIPILISKILNKYNLEYGSNDIQVLNNNIYIYPREYFYPYSYNRDNNKFTDNTCMIHYYDASWIPLKDRIENGMIRKLGKTKTFKILDFYRKAKDIIRKIAKVILFPIVIYRNYKKRKALITEEYLLNIENTIKNINKYKNKEYITMHNSKWIGVTSATHELFENTVDCGEIYRDIDIEKISQSIINNNIKQVIFSSFTEGEKKLVKYLKHNKKDIKIKTYWHGNHSQVLDQYGWKRNTEIIELHKKGYIDVMATCKESLIEFYKNEGYKTKFITNKVTTNIKPDKKQKTNKKRIGLYAAKCDNWRKNMFTQMAAVSLMDNAILDMVPLNPTAIEFAKKIGLEIDGIDHAISREELLKRMSNNDLNLYVTYSECAPMLPLESFEMDVPCITGNNHHYFQGKELEKYLVVNNEEDPVAIKNTIENCIKNEDKIKKLYKEFKEENLKNATKSVEEFIKM